MQAICHPDSSSGCENREEFDLQLREISRYGVTRRLAQNERYQNQKRGIGYADVNTGNREKSGNSSFTWYASDIRNPCNTGKSRGIFFLGSLFILDSR
jgi:hypothetical protein